jgi:hypothetical protein
LLRRFYHVVRYISRYRGREAPLHEPSVTVCVCERERRHFAPHVAWHPSRTPTPGYCDASAAPRTTTAAAAARPSAGSTTTTATAASSTWTRKNSAQRAPSTTLAATHAAGRGTSPSTAPRPCPYFERVKNHRRQHRPQHASHTNTPSAPGDPGLLKSVLSLRCVLLIHKLLANRVRSSC